MALNSIRESIIFKEEEPTISGSPKKSLKCVLPPDGATASAAAGT